MTDNLPPDQAITHIDGADLHQMLSVGLDWLKQHSHIVNALNVFPVPDGDTGTNMVLTMQSAWGKAAEHPSSDVGTVAQAYAQGAVRGARGNSGVILSQILRGFSEQLADTTTIDAKQFAAAMQQATQTAYKGVLKPVEGTILTVIREAATASGHAAAISLDLRFVLDTTLLKAKQALDNTPNLLPVLKQAGVVDAGGQGLYYIMEGMAKHLRGETLPPPESITVGGPSEAVPQPDLDVFGEDEWGYDIQYLIFGDDLDEDEIRQQLLSMGGVSVVVGRAGNVVKVHVHNEDPGPFITYGASLGHLDDIVLENMTLQTLRRKGDWSEDAPVLHATPAPAETFEESRKCPGVVAVAAGEGLRKVFESLGVCAVVQGGQTMNPSTEDLLLAAEQLPQEDVIILPNNKNIILAARQAAEISEKRIHVIETRSAQQGISAMWGFNAEAGVEHNIAAMTEAFQDTISAEVTTAVRDVSFDGIDVKEGDLIGLIDGKLRCRGDNLDDLVQRILERMDPLGETEVFTLYYGAQVRETEAQALLERLEPLFPEHEIELLYGGQPHYHYLISAE
ncbi:MAG TPA: DAK2 domain-containing protein [Caldilineae bacterium]|nr:DAK2 domain-containing protein [Caldilineae bacterium]